MTVKPGDVVRLRTASGAVQVLTGSTFKGVTGALVARGGRQYELQIRVPIATLYSTPEVTARLNGSYLGHVAGEFAWYLSVRVEGDQRVYSRIITVDPGDTVDLRTAAGETSMLRVPAS
ncbi:hypothetical protein [Leifsonia shinshuensis]|uniref:hypothetical protein n=1 Tax=Leifsonia shinshuensis TaxID=150026 RepID=UPI00285872DB|nr:hypothetical protein [Leifsonia shinshuensis]MDR6972078.1 hypothetical protein [Leifsonia shinshuensis]